MWRYDPLPKMHMTFLTDASLYFNKAGPSENVSNVGLI